MELNKLLPLLQKSIDKEMLELNRLGQESKKLLQQAHKKERELAAHFMTLKPVHAIVREQNPTLCEFFDSLVELDKDIKQKEADGNE